LLSGGIDYEQLRVAEIELGEVVAFVFYQSCHWEINDAEAKEGRYIQGVRKAAEQD
jgi:hypothetical protein